MSKAAYLMARLTARGIQPGMSFGGIPELTKTDIAACCSGLPSLAFHLMMAKYCDDVFSAREAVGELQERMCNKSAILADLDPIKRTLIAAWLVSDFKEANRCRRCKGTALQVEDSKIVQCKRCKGEGKEAASSRSRADWMKIPETTWRESGLNKECEFMERDLADMEISALYRVARKAS